MPLFPCSKCNCAEDTALSHFWGARVRQQPSLCSACDPTIGKWHGEFPRESADDFVRDRQGFLLDKRAVEHWLGQPIEILAKPQPQRRPPPPSVKVHVLALATAAYTSQAA